MNEDLKKFINEVDVIVKEAEVYTFITRGREEQVANAEALNTLREKAAALKTSSQERQNEDEANFILGLECALESLSSQLKMWAALKDNQADQAWDYLISAQNAAHGALRAHSQFNYLKNYTNRLMAIEHLIFPPQVFSSSGFIVKRQECSICGNEYEDCPHLKGKPYMGKFCYITARDVELDHVSIVDDPADKRCRITHFDDEGGKRNRMTWLIEEEDKKIT
jgi:hypothetical protein